MYWSVPLESWPVFVLESVRSISNLHAFTAAFSAVPAAPTKLLHSHGLSFRLTTMSRLAAHLGARKPSVCGRQNPRILAPPFQVFAGATAAGLLGNA
jgi:hypothetical protein